MAQAVLHPGCERIGFVKALRVSVNLVGILLFGGTLCNGYCGSYTFLAAFCLTAEPCLPKVYRRFQRVINTVNEYLLTD